jgi:hypothetical protein
MDGNPLLNPVGSLPPQVYWRRRAMIGVLSVLVIWFAWGAFPGKSGANAAQGSGKSAKTAQSAGVPSTGTTPAATPTAAATTPAPVVTTPAPAAVVTSPPAPTTTAAKVPAAPKCTSLDLTLTADHTLYTTGVMPHFVLTVTNVGSAACRADVGTSARNFLVTSGTDRIWSSADCTKTSANVAVFKAKQAVGYTHDWLRARSSAAGCAAHGTQARPGTYKVVAHVGDLTSNTVVFRLS